MDDQPLETTVYSLSDRPPEPGDRRAGERHLTLFRVGTMVIGDRRELCLIRNISAGGMRVRVYAPVALQMRVSIELKHGDAVSGIACWVEGDSVGITFDTPVDVVELLATSMEGPRPRMPRVEIACVAWVRDGAVTHRTQACNVSQGGVRVLCPKPLTVGTHVIVTLSGIAPQAATVRWAEEGLVGIRFNRVLALPVLVDWLHAQRERLRLAS